MPRSDSLRAACYFHDRFTDWGFACAAAAVAIIGLSSCYEVAARYLFSAPTTWAYDATGYLFCAAIFLSMPQLSRSGGHVAITIASDLASPRLHLLLKSLIQIAGVAACTAVAWIGLGESIRQYMHGIETLAVRPIPKWMVSSFIVYGMGSSALYFARNLFACLRDRAAVDQTRSR